MVITNALLDRCGSACELCAATSDLTAYIVMPKTGETIEEQVAVCRTCSDALENNPTEQVDHWRCLNDSIWNPNPAVQVTAYRILHAMDGEVWAQNLANMMYMDEETMEWAHSGQVGTPVGIIHKDSNGNILSAGDTVTLIQDLNVKGANFTAKRGTAVRRIRLVHDNPEHIEGKVDGQQIVILTKFCKKSN